ncbi:MAG: T9SS type A sorting domain-containing protein [Chitinophagaceae bacterium]
MISLTQGLGQTTNLSGVVNTYHKVIEILPSKSCLRVADPTGLNLNNLVMVIQMKGATINTNANSIGFGDTTNLFTAGHYEIGTICYIIGDSVFLFHDLLNFYDVNSSVQLVQFADHYSINVTDTIKALKWDKNTGLGGVIAIFADQDITLNAPVFADSAGYGGGSFLLSSGTCFNGIGAASNYAYSASLNNPQNGAYKGEGVADIANSQTGGRGAPANGGGGGNNHNNSGGGGANLTAGGIGGGNSSSTGCTTTLRGLGGKALGTWGGKKIFMGGGGGAGHANYALSESFGGDGGGIIFIWANNLIGNNYSISANGQTGGTSLSDGAGGGGAGGTIIMHVANYTGNVNIHALGGNGGASADGNTIQRCYGGGGGGSGGAVYFTGSIPAVSISLNGGSYGVESGRDPGCAAEQRADPGSSGISFSNYTFPRSTNPAGYCELLLPSRLLYFNVRVENGGVVLSWQTDHPELVDVFIIEKRTGNSDWVALPGLHAENGKTRYGMADAQVPTGRTFYRLKVLEKNGAPYYSVIRQVWLDAAGSGFTIYPNPSSGLVTLSGNFEANSLLQVTDITGRIVWQQPFLNTAARIELPRLAAGLYLVRYRDEIKKLLVK